MLILFPNHDFKSKSVKHTKIKENIKSNNFKFLSPEDEILSISPKKTYQMLFLKTGIGASNLIHLSENSAKQKLFAVMLV